MNVIEHSMTQGQKLLSSASQNPDNLNKALAIYHNLIKTYPNEALAHGKLFECYTLLVGYGKMGQDKAFKHASHHLSIATELDPRDLEILHLKAHCQLYIDLDLITAQTTLQKILKKDPLHLRAQHTLIDTYLYQRKDQKFWYEVKNMQTNHPGYLSDRHWSWYFYYLRDYDRAFHHALKMQKKETQSHNSKIYLARIAIQCADTTTALQSLRDIGADQAHHGLSKFGEYTTCLALAGQVDAAEKNLQFMQMEAKQDLVFPLYRMLQIMISLKKPTQEIHACLDACIEKKDPFLLWMKIDPLMDTIRPDPKYQSLAKRLHLNQM